MRGSRAFLAACGAVTGFAIGYALPALARLPSLHYDPLGRSLSLARRPIPGASGYLGQLLWGAASALLGGLLLSLWPRRGFRGESEAIALASAWALTAVALVGGWLTWQNWP